MHSFELENFRAFGQKRQAVRLAPLTLLVGENSTGKTSFMALIRAIWDVAYADNLPDFNDPPYNLGTFENIVHNHRSSASGKSTFEASFELPDKHRFAGSFSNRNGSPYPTFRRYSNDEAWIQLQSDTPPDVQRTDYSGRTIDLEEMMFLADDDSLFPLRLVPTFVERAHGEEPSTAERLNGLLAKFRDIRYHEDGERRPYASAPIRSRPERTYNPELSTRNPEGRHVPSLLFQLFRKGGEEWKRFNKQLHDFGQSSELFDEIQIRASNESESSSFQIQVRLGTTNGKSPFVNLIDVGYGVSQILPLLVELMRPDGPRMFLLQQPEVHLHPRAQAALGTLFCSHAASGKQLLVETHSDHLIDRVRMAVRDRDTELKPEDVSILYFERNDLDVEIHSISVDWLGNIMGAPPEYRRFFMDEMGRLIGFTESDDDE